MSMFRVPATCVGALLLVSQGSASDPHGSGHSEGSHAAGAPAAAAAAFVKLGDGQCNGGVGGFGEFKCVGGGGCNAGGQPLKPATETGTGCAGGEYLACNELLDMTESSCENTCAKDRDCLGFMISHSGVGGGKCELHTRLIESVSKPLECYKYSDSAFSLLGHGACRSMEVTGPDAPVPGTYYGDYNVTFTLDFLACKNACEGSSRPCTGIEFAKTPGADGTHKCEVHYAALSSQRMVTFACYERESLLGPGGDGEQLMAGISGAERATTQHVLPLLLVVVVSTLLPGRCL